MHRTSTCLTAAVAALIIWFGSAHAGAQNAPSLEDDRIRAMVHDEVERQLKDRVPAEVKRQLTELIQQARAHAAVPPTQAKLEHLTRQLEILRAQLALYALQHNDAYPTLTQLNAGWSVLTNPTDVAGNTGPRKPFGPYLKEPIANPFNNSTSVAPAGHATAKDGWSFDEKNHSLFAVVPQNLESLTREGQAEAVQSWTIETPK